MKKNMNKTTKNNFHIKKTSCIIRLYLKVSQFGYSLSLWGNLTRLEKCIGEMEIKVLRI